MPELPEVHRATHFLRLYLLSTPHTLRASYCPPATNSNPATLHNDPKIFDTAKTGLDAASFCKSLAGKKVKDVGRLGKYFWLEMESPPHPLFHFGMTGWVKYKGSKGKGVEYWEGKTEGRKEDGGKRDKRKTAKDEDEDEEAVDGEDESAERPQEVPKDEWPPRFAKMLFEATSDSGEVTEFAFVDGRRFSKIQMVHPESGKSIRDTEPLASNGPDPVLEADKLTPDWLDETLTKRKVAIKAFLLDQHALSGVGNWVADEVLFHAQIHPEKIANALNENEIKRLAEQLKSVCKIAAIDALGDSHKFPDDWLMRHRWRLDKTENAGVLPSGEKIVRITVGGRTSAVVPSRQGHGPGAVAKQEEEAEGRPSKKRKSKVAKEDDDDAEGPEGTDEDVDEEPAPKSRRGARGKSKHEDDEPSGKPRSKKKPVSDAKATDAVKSAPSNARKSARRSKGGRK